MKKALIICVALFVMGIGAYALNENVVVWEQIYDQTDRDDQRVAVVIKIMEFKDREFVPLLVRALGQVTGGRLDLGSPTERYSRTLLATLLVQELGNLKSSEGAEIIFRLYGEIKDPVLKGEAAMALGKIRAADYAQTLSFDLASINLKADPAISRNQEIIALALVQSLNAMRSPIGYEPVFLASYGWYSSTSKVKETARAALLTIVDDPSDSVLKIIAENPSIDIKIDALKSLLASKAPADRKSMVASRALQIGIERATVDKASEAAASKLRIASIVALTELRDRTGENVARLVGIIGRDKKNDATFDETIKAYVALGINGSDEAAAFLKTKMSEYNVMEKSKANTPRDKILIRQVIASMVLSKNPLVKNTLVQSQFIDYDSQIIREIEAALKNF
jgi:hypothetical protein